MKEQADQFFSKEEEQLIIKAIQEAESHTSGEIRVHLENHTQKDNFSRAKEVFEEIGMSKTEQHNGVLFYLAVQDHHFSILGDTGINEKVTDNFWEYIKETMQGYFSKGEFAKGMVEGITMAGKALKEYYPLEEDDENELSDLISKS